MNDLSRGRGRALWICVAVLWTSVAAGCGDSGGEPAVPDAQQTVDSDGSSGDTEVPDVGPDGVEDATPDVAPDQVADAEPDQTGDAEPDQDAEQDVAPDTSPDSQPDAGPDAADTAGDSGPDVEPAEPAELLVEAQTLIKPYDTVTVQVATLPSDATVAGALQVQLAGGADDGAVVGSAPLEVGQTYQDLTIQLDDPVVGSQLLAVVMVDGAGEPILAPDTSPVKMTFPVLGDTEDPELVVNSQMIDPADFYTLNIDHVVVPERFDKGIYLAIYEAPQDGSPGALRGKQKFDAGEHTNTAFAVTSKFIEGHTLHAVMREPLATSGGWDSSGAIVQTISGQDMIAVFEADSVAFQPALEIDDQQLPAPGAASGTQDLMVKKVTIPQQYLGGSWVAVYADDAGQPGALIGTQYFTKGTKEDVVVELDVPQEGEHTLHAALHAGQTWAEAQDNLMLGQGDEPVWVTFKVGAADLSYILATPYTTYDPRIVRLDRAYSFDKPAWIVLARDDAGQPGTLLAIRKVPQKYAGNVWFHKNTTDFLQQGTAAEYLTGEPGTFRRAIRGQETVHVLMYEDDPADGQFTWTEGGTEDMPVLDSGGQQVTATWDVTVQSSVDNSQKDSSRYYFPCVLSQYTDNPTTLPVDCRCHVNIETLDFPECKSVIADGLGMSFGAGPRVRTLNFGRWRSGFTEPATSELIALAVWKDAQTVWPENDTTLDVGAVMGVHVETRERRLISGRYDDPVQGIVDIGAGPVLSHPFELQKGPDGKYYVASYGYVKIDASLTPTVDIIRVDPDTGDREYVWRSNHLGYNLDGQDNPYGHCANGRDAKYGYASVQIGRKAFGIDGDGNFYLSYAHNGNTPTSDGIGIIEVSADGSSCDFVTRTKVGADNVLYQGQSIGAGPEPQAGPYKGMLVKDGKLYTTTELTDELWEIDIATGDRKALHVYGVDDTNTGSSGTHVVWDPHRDIIWQAGFSSATLLYDPATETSEPLWCPENYRDYKGINCMKAGAWGNNGLLLERGLWMHPTKPEYMFVVNGSMIQRVDLPAGQSEIFSY